jgi:2-hydroxy-6-oxonona-2,4-dienedioate hydrolase
MSISLFIKHCPWIGIINFLFPFLFMSFPSLLFGKNRNENDAVFMERRAPIRSIPLHLQSLIQQKISGNHIFLEAGAGKPVIFCHGLFGGIFNIDIVCTEIAKEYRFLMPYLPIHDLPLLDCTIQNLGDYLEIFINDLQLEEAIVIGNSVGGGAALYCAAKSFGKIKGLVLCGSSGLSSIPLVNGFFQRKNIALVKEAIQDIFFNRDVVPPEMVQDVFNAIQRNKVVLRSIRFTKSATHYKMHRELPGIHTPTLLVWGRQDPITPVEVAHQFTALLPHATLFVLHECGHVPTQEKPYQFLGLFFDFVEQLNY